MFDVCMYVCMNECNCLCIHNSYRKHVQYNNVCMYNMNILYVYLFHGIFECTYQHKFKYDCVHVCMYVCL
jgi:hypothetical protein